MGKKYIISMFTLVTQTVILLSYMQLFYAVPRFKSSFYDLFHSLNVYYIHQVTKVDH